MDIRPATVADIPALARIHVDSWRATYTGIVPAAYLDAMAYAKSETTWQRLLAEPDKGFTLTLCLDGAVVGYASGGPEREGVTPYDGELYAIYLLPAQKGKGLGRLLASALASELQGLGYTSMIVWVLEDNPARHFYESLGGQLVGRKTISIGGTKLEEISYGWTDLTALIRT